MPNSSPQDLQQIISLWNPKLAQRNIEERFEQGASLWLIRSEDRAGRVRLDPAGTHGRAPLLPLGDRTMCSFFDFHVFPKFRGRANSLVPDDSYSAASWQANGMARAFGDAAEWNQASLSSLQ